MKIELILILILVPIVMSKEVIINCQAHNEDMNSTNIKTCSVIRSLNITEENTKVLIVISKSEIGRTSASKVSWFKAENQTIFYFPEGISTNFSHISHLTIKNSHLKTIGSSKLRNFKNLSYLDLSYNEILIIEPALFQYNDKLKDIRLNNNNIYYIHHDSFLALQNINFLDIMNNKCYSSIAESHEQAMSIPQQTVCPLNVSELYEEIQNIKTNAESTKHVIFILNICIGASLVIIIVMFIFIYYNLTCKQSAVTDVDAKNNKEYISAMTKPMIYGFNDYVSSNESKLKANVDLEENYDEIRYSHYRGRVAVPETNTEDFYSDLSVLKIECAMKDDEESYNYSTV
ncbi:hypothetical protein ACKWTF_014168 [Chironomus riparius]